MAYQIEGSYHVQFPLLGQVVGNAGKVLRDPLEKKRVSTVLHETGPCQAGANH